MKYYLYITCLLVTFTLKAQITITDTDISNKNAGEGDLYKHNNGTIYIGLSSGTYYKLSGSSTVSYDSPLKSFGKINSDGAAAKIVNATANRITTGQYQITFSSPMTDANYIIQLAQPSRNGAGSDDPGIAYYDQETTGFKVRIGDNDNGASVRNKFDSEFMFTIFDYNTPTIPSSGIIGTLTTRMVVHYLSDGQNGTSNNFSFQIQNQSGQSINYQALIENAPYSNINGLTLQGYTYLVIDNNDGTYNHLFTSTVELSAWGSISITGGNNILPPGNGKNCNCITFYEF